VASLALTDGVLPFCTLNIHKMHHFVSNLLFIFFNQSNIKNLSLISLECLVCNTLSLVNKGVFEQKLIN
jgi:hypothetical protein